jgi:hypothetical protein
MHDVSLCECNGNIAVCVGGAVVFQVDRLAVEVEVEGVVT